MTLQPVILAVSSDDLPRSQASLAEQRRFAREALSLCAERSGAPPEGWLQRRTGAPVPNNGFHWSLSHKPRWVGAVISEGPVGIDIEHVVPRREGLWEAVGRLDEWPILGGQSWTSFHRLWTAKEAVLKANGVGIGHLGECHLVAASGKDCLRVGRGREIWPVWQHFFFDHIAAVASHASPVLWTVIPQTQRQELSASS